MHELKKYISTGKKENVVMKICINIKLKKIYYEYTYFLLKWEINYFSLFTSLI